MNKIFKVNIILVISILFIFLANGCTKSVSKNNTKAIIPSPDRIMLYNLGKSKEIKKGDKEFDKVISLTNDRIDIKKLSSVKDTVDDGFIDLKKIRVMAVEFIYDKEQKLSVKGDGFGTIKYNKLFFELYDALESNAPGGVGYKVFQYGDLNHYKDSSRGPIKQSEELITIVEGIVHY